MKYLIVNGELLENPNFNAAEKLLLSYIIGLETQNRYFFGTLDYLADQLGANCAGVRSVVKNLIDRVILSQDSAGVIRTAVNHEQIFTYKKPTATQEQIVDKLKTHIKFVNSRLQSKDQGGWNEDL